jgi:sec-independent protein translocase protein TatC
LTGSETITRADALTENTPPVRFVFTEKTKIGTVVVLPGVSVTARAVKEANGGVGLYTDEPLVVGNLLLPKGARLPFTPGGNEALKTDAKGKLVITTTVGSFTLYMKVALYAALALAVPFLLWQIWGFVSPGLYQHERAYVTPFVSLSSISFVIGAAFAYYLIFPPAARYLLGIGSGFQLLLNADDYFDFIILIMMAMGLVFQMPAITYVLSRIGLVNAGLLVRAWKTALVIILIAAAVLSPTSDIPNMMLFALPMIVLYVISIFIAWMFGKERQPAGS